VKANSNGNSGSDGDVIADNNCHGNSDGDRCNSKSHFVQSICFHKSFKQIGNSTSRQAGRLVDRSC